MKRVDVLIKLCPAGPREVPAPGEPPGDKDPGRVVGRHPRRAQAALPDPGQGPQGGVPQAEP